MIILLISDTNDKRGFRVNINKTRREKWTGQSGERGKDQYVRVATGVARQKQCEVSRNEASEASRGASGGEVRRARGGTVRRSEASEPEAKAKRKVKRGVALSEERYGPGRRW